MSFSAIDNGPEAAASAAHHAPTSGSRSPRRLLIVEECLVDAKGHYLNFIRGISLENQARGFKVTVVANRAFDPALIPEATAIPFFSKTWLQSYSQSSGMWRFVACLGHNVRFFRDMSRLLDGRGPFDCVLATHANVFNLLGWRLLCASSLRASRVVMALQVPIWVYRYVHGSLVFLKQSVFTKFVYRMFRRRVLSGRCSFVVETERDAAVQSSWSNVPFDVLPTPRGVDLLRHFQKFREPACFLDDHHSAPPVKVLWVGRATPDRGFPAFVNAVEAILDSYSEPTVCFEVQLFDSFGGREDLQERIRKLAERHPLLTLVRGDLHGAEYARWIASADVVVLPYEQAEYVERFSSLALDAFCCGIPIITTEGTWMAKAMSKWGAGLTIPDGDAQALAQALLEFVSRRHELRKNAEAGAKVAIAANSWDQLIAVIWGEQHPGTINA